MHPHNTIVRLYTHYTAVTCSLRESFAANTECTYMQCMYGEHTNPTNAHFVLKLFLCKVKAEHVNNRIQITSKYKFEKCKDGACNIDKQ